MSTRPQADKKVYQKASVEDNSFKSQILHFSRLALQRINIQKNANHHLKDGMKVASMKVTRWIQVLPRNNNQIIEESLCSSSILITQIFSRPRAARASNIKDKQFTSMNTIVTIMIVLLQIRARLQNIPRCLTS